MSPAENQMYSSMSMFKSKKYKGMQKGKMRFKAANYLKKIESLLQLNENHHLYISVSSRISLHENDKQDLLTERFFTTQTYVHFLSPGRGSRTEYNYLALTGTECIRSTPVQKQVKANQVVYNVLTSSAGSQYCSTQGCASASSTVIRL